MAKPRGREHTTLTETADLVVRVLQKISGLKMIAPGEIRTVRNTRGGKRYITVVYTKSGCEILVTGQSVQKIAVHFDSPIDITKFLSADKNLKDFTFKERHRKPGE